MSRKDKIVQRVVFMTQEQADWLHTLADDLRGTFSEAVQVYIQQAIRHSKEDPYWSQIPEILDAAESLMMCAGGPEKLEPLLEALQEAVRIGKPELGASRSRHVRACYAKRKS